MIGVYIPAYNVGKYIKESIESIKNQTLKDFQVVIIDDCSSDNTYDVAKKHIDSRFSIHRNSQHSGFIGKIKNKSIHLLDDHKYICHVGSDDIIPNNCFEIFFNYMENHPDIGACCGNFICFNETKQWTFPHVANSGEFDSKILLKYMCMFPMRFYKKSAVRDVGYYSEELSSAVDYDLALKLSEKYKIHRIKDPITYYYRQHSQQVSTKARSEQDLNAKRALQNALKRRNINGIIENDSPPFKVKIEEHFIWGAK